jgi:predicted membrane channel-forming protein YqfA (hemolysin III family)
MIRRLLRNTPGGKVGAIDGLNLFFGALLGANLGTMQALALRDYVTLVVLLAGTVMVLRMLSTSERRAYMLSLVGVYVAIFAVVLLFVPPKGISPDDLHRLAATLGIWVLCILGTELSPVREP